MSKRTQYILAALIVVLLAAGLRLYAAQRLDVDYDEPVYLSAAVEYAAAMRSGDLKMLAWSEHTYEHPALRRSYGVVLLTSRRSTACPIMTCASRPSPPLRPGAGISPRGTSR
jgi:hypothetical protein